ncbi:hypothetical protein JW930_02150 [Candidatus Woesearchaeota archaeon]|nr:hypothetical protein [Candidatus Woesearchaeota archaeon]
MTLLSTLALIVGSIMALSALPQAYKIFRRKSAKDIAIVTYIILIIGGLVWLLYGIEIDNFALILANTLGIITSTIVVSGWFLYGR